jgi:hypothetical protein
MKKYVVSFLLSLLMASGAFAQETRRGFVDATDCGQLTNPVTGAIICLQTTDTSTRTKGTLYTWTGTQWAAYVIGTGLASLNGLVAGSQTFVNDTNVTITSTGTTHTLGFAGQLALTRGGTAGTTAAEARTNLGLVIGTNVQAQNSNLSALGSIVGTGLYKVTGSGTSAFAAFGDVVGLWASGSCSGFLKNDGTCASATVTEADPIVKAINGLVKSNTTTISAAVAGTDYVVPDAELTALAGLTSAADRLPYFTGSGTASLATFTAFGRSLVDDADATAGRTTLGLGTIATQASSAVTITGGSITGITDLAVADGGTGASSAGGARTNLGLVIGTDVQAFDPELAALAGLTSLADKLPYFTGAGTAATADFTAFGRSLVDDANAAAARITLGLVVGTDVQAQDIELSALAGLSSAADRLPYFTGTGTASLTTFTAFARTLLDDVDAATARTTLGAQASDTELTALASVTSAADKLPYFTGSGTATVTDLTAYGRLIAASVDEAGFKALVNLENADIVATINAAGTLTVSVKSLTNNFADSACTDGGSTDAYVCTPTAAPTAYITNASYRIKVPTVNTSAGGTSVNINSLGVKAIKKWVSGSKVDPANGDICAGQIIDLVYDGTDMILQSVSCNPASGSVSGTTGTILKAGSSTTAVDSAIIEDADSVNFSKPIEACAGATCLFALDTSVFATTLKTWAFPVNASDTFMGLAAAQTPTNKTIDDSTNTLKVTKSVQVELYGPTTATATCTGCFYFRVPVSLNGTNLVGIQTNTVTAGTTGLTSVQITRCVAVATTPLCSGTTASMLSTVASIDSGETSSSTAATAGVINTANDDVATAQILRFDVTAINTTPATGLIVNLDFKLP